MPRLPALPLLLFTLVACTPVATVEVDRDLSRGIESGGLSGDALAAAYVDRGKQGKTEGLLLLPIKLSPNLQGQDRGAHARVNAQDKRVILPTKAEAYGSIEGLMNHFMLVMEGYGIRPPAGEAYFAAEGANGELGFYVVSDGGDRPYRVPAGRRACRRWPRCTA